MSELNLPISETEILSLLESKGFERTYPDIVELAQSVLGKCYRRGARLHEAPEVFDCSSLTKWLYGQMGLWLPRRAIQQRAGGKPASLSEILPGDLIFTSGWIDRYIDDPSDGVGHVGMAVSSTKIIHAASKKLGVIESRISNFTDENKFRGARRIVDFSQCITLKLPQGRDIETSDDIRWVILENLPRSL